MHLAKFRNAARTPENIYVVYRPTSPGDGQTPANVCLASVERRRCSNAAKTRNPLKIAGVPQTNGPISAASGPKFTLLWGMWRRYCCLTSFFPIVDMCLSCEDIARQSCAMVPRWRIFREFLRSVFQQAACSTFQTCILNSH